MKNPLEVLLIPQHHLFQIQATEIAPAACQYSQPLTVVDVLLK
jgi:hypothetical protein